MPTPLLLTKLYFPKSRRQTVLRPRLLETLSSALQVPLTLIVAPAGYGKTTLMSAWRAGPGAKTSAAWLTLDEEDNDPQRFLRYLTAAINQIQPGLVENTTAVVNSPQLPSTEMICVSLLNELSANRLDLLIVLDDYHLLDHPELHALMTFLLDHCPDQLHFVILTRADPPLPLARFRARGQMVELRSVDLRFSMEETREFLNEVMGLRVPDRSIALLEQRTEGWIAGLQMAALSMRSSKDIPRFVENFSGSNRYIMDFLLEEILSAQPPEIQQFLLVTSILDQFSAPLCDFLLDIPQIRQAADSAQSAAETPTENPAADILGYLERANIFLQPLDDDRAWFRYHHLFAGLLQSRLHETYPGAVAALHNQAAVWFEQQGYIAETIQHLITAGNFDQAANLIELHASSQVLENDPDLLYLSHKLPRPVILAHPKIGLHQAWALINRGKIDQVISLFHDLKQALSDLPSDHEREWIQTFILAASIFLHPSTPAQLPEIQMLEAIPAGERTLKNAAEYLYTMALGRRGNLDQAIQIAERYIQQEASSSGMGPVLTLMPFVSRAYLMKGCLAKSERICLEALNPTIKHNLRFQYASGSFKVDLGEIYYERNQLKLAEQSVREGLKDNQHWENIMTEGFGLVALAHILIAKRDFHGAEQVIDQFETRMSHPTRPAEFDEEYHTLRVRAQLAEGRIEEAAVWAEAIQHSGAFRQHPDSYRYTIAKILIAQHRYAEAVEMLTNMVILPPVGSFRSRQISVQLHLAAAAGMTQNPNRSLSIIAECLDLAEPEGYLRVFLEPGEPVHDLLLAYQQSHPGEHQSFVHAILNAFPPPENETLFPTQTDGLVESLTARELEILEAIALGKTNKQIAQQLFVASGTIKAHAASIYRKLDVANRTEAVARARQLGIIS